MALCQQSKRQNYVFENFTFHSVLASFLVDLIYQLTSVFSFWAGRVLQYTIKIKGKFVLIYEREAFSGLVTDKGSSFLGLFLKGMP